MKTAKKVEVRLPTEQARFAYDINNYLKIVVDADGTSTLTPIGTAAKILAESLTVTDDAYNATSWDGNLGVPTKNAIRDKLESLATGGISIGSTIGNSPNANSILFVGAGGVLANSTKLTWDDTAASLKTPDGTVGSVGGGSFGITTGNGTAGGDGGWITYVTGSGGATGYGGSFEVYTGTSASEYGGDINFSCGTGGTSGGSIRLEAGSGGATNSRGGTIRLSPGDKTGSGAVGWVEIKNPSAFFFAKLDTTAITANRTYTFPDSSGTLALSTSSLSIGNVIGNSPNAKSILFVNSAGGTLAQSTKFLWDNTANIFTLGEQYSGATITGLNGQVSGDDGNDITIKGGNGNGSASGGNLYFTGGSAGATGGSSTGGFTFTTPNPQATTGRSGGFQVNLGSGGSTSGDGGTFAVNAGNSPAAIGGSVTFNAGSGGTTAGSVGFTAGSGTGSNSNGGNITFQAGAKTGSGTLGLIRFRQQGTSIYANFDLSLLATSDKTFTFPNSSGTFALTSDLSGFITGNQNITLSGDVSGSGTTAITTAIGANKVTLGMMAQMATASILGRNTAGTGNVEVLSGSTVKSIIGLANVENTALSTWVGNTAITSVGTIGTGTWQGSVIGSTYGGTGVNNAGRTLTINTNSGTISFTSAASTLTVAATGSISGTNTGDQTITLTGDVSGSGTGSFATAIGSNKVTLGMLATLAANSVIGNSTGSVATPTAISMTTTATANAIVRRDGNTNAFANNFLDGYASTATVAGTTTLTVTSARKQNFTGVTTQTVTLPVVSTLALGHTFEITNNSTGVVTVNSSGGNTVQAMASGSRLIVTSNATSGTAETVWNKTYIPVSGAGGGISNSAGSNVIMKSDGVNAVASSLTDDGTTVKLAASTNLGSLYQTGFISFHADTTQNAIRFRPQGTSYFKTFENNGTDIYFQFVPNTGKTVLDSYSAPMQLGVTGSNALYIDSSSNLSIGGHTNGSAKVHIISTTQQFRIGYDTANYWRATVDSAGNVEWDGFATSSAPCTFTIQKALITPWKTLTDGATVSIDARAGTKFYHSGTTGRTFSAPTSPSSGQQIVIAMKNTSGADITHTFTAGASGWRYGSDITALSAVAAGKTDYLTAVWNSTDSRWDIIGYVKGYA